MELVVRILIWLGVILFLVALGGLFWLFLRLKSKGIVRRSLDMGLFLIRLPKYEKDKEQKLDFRDLIGRAEQLYMAFSGLKADSFWERFIQGPPRAAFEIASEGGSEEVGFYIAVARNKRTILTKTVHGVYPEASVEPVPEDYNIFIPGGANAVRFLQLEKSTYLPIKTYRKLESDPLNTLATTLSQIPETQGAAVQLVITAVERKWENAGRLLIKHLKEGMSFKQALHEVFGFKLPFFKKSKQEQDEALPKLVDETALEGVQDKLKKVNFRVNLRLVASAPTQLEAETVVEQLQSAFSQFSSPEFNAFKAKKPKGRRRKKEIFDFVFRNLNLKNSIVLNTEELASLFHLSLSRLEVPKLKGLKSRQAPLPEELPKHGVLTLGTATYRGQERPVQFATREDRRRHLYVIGQTGTGKTSLFREMIRQDIEAGEGVGVIDPHGDLIEDTLANIPRERFEDVVLFEPFDVEHPMGLNMLEWKTPESKDFAVQEMVAIFQKLFPPEIIGPMFEHYMRNAMLALMADQDDPGTLVEIPRIFTDEDYMESRLRKVQDPVVRQFWLKEWKQTTGQTKSDMLGYVVSKIGRFVENTMLRNIIGQPHSAFDLGKIMDEGKIFLANLSKGRTGEINSALLGLILVSKLQMAAMRRAQFKTEQERKDFYLYIDEFQNFTTDSIATILSEARKYRLNLNLAHQFIAQLDEKIRDAVFGNVGSLVAFRVGAEDAQLLEKQFEPEFTKQDLINLDNFYAVIKLMVRGQITSPFKMRTLKPQPGAVQQVETIKKLAKLKYSRSKQEVEREILKRTNL